MKIKNNIILLLTLSILLGLYFTYSLRSKNPNISCTGTVMIDSPGNHNYVFNGTVSVKITPGADSMISIFGTNQLTLLPSKEGSHLVNRDIIFNVTKKIKSDYYISNVKIMSHPEDNMSEQEYLGFVFDMFHLENNRITIRKFSNAFVFGDVPIPSFVCVKKK